MPFLPRGLAAEPEQACCMPMDADSHWAGLQRTAASDRVLAGRSSPYHPALATSGTSRLSSSYPSQTLNCVVQIPVQSRENSAASHCRHGCFTGFHRSCICSKAVHRYFCCLRLRAEQLHFLSEAGPHQGTLSCRMVELLAGENGVQSEHSLRIISSQQEIRYATVLLTAM
jgi:hypothetical protein